MGVVRAVHPPARVARAALEAHPGLAQAVRRIAGEHGIPEQTVSAHLGEAVLAALDTLGEAYVREMGAAIERVVRAREAVHRFYDTVFSPDGTTASLSELERLFADLQREMDGLAAPERWARAHSEDPAPQAPAVLPERGTGGRAREVLAGALPSEAAHTALAALPSAEQAAVRRAMELAPAAVRSVVASEVRVGPARGAQRPAPLDAVLEAIAAEHGLGPAERAALERGLTALNREHTGALGRAPEMHPAALGLPAGSTVAAEMLRARRLRQLAAQNPEHFTALVDGWVQLAASRREQGLPVPSLTAYVRRIMRTQMRGMHGEITAAFALGPDFWLLKAPGHDVTVPGTDFVVVSRRTGELWFCDNKALSAEQLSTVTSLVQNVQRNLAEDAAAFGPLLRESGVDLPPPVLDAIVRARRASGEVGALVARAEAEGMSPQALQAAVTAVLDANGIRRVVTNAGGELGALGPALVEAGVDLADLRGAVVEPPSRPLGGAP